MDDPLPPLTPTEVRVLGSLIEKAITTPDYYPLSLNALTNACNQLTNREPVMSLEENEVVRAIDGLRDKRLATLFTGAESRVAKYKHTLTDALLLTPAEVALLTVLMLRGPQTIGELRTRCERLYKFDTLSETEEALNTLASRPSQPLVAKLPRAPGTKESRYTHLLSGSMESTSSSQVGSPTVAAPTASPLDEPPRSQPDEGGRVDVTRLAALEQETAALRREVEDLKQQLAAFRKQFE